MIVIDGSKGEGGGQILRTALAISCIVNEPFRIENIRAGRSEPGLRAQHSCAVSAAAQISEATVEGNSIGSTEVVFSPVKTKPGHYFLEVGTAGSVTLVLQTVYLPLALCHDESRLKIDGGTHVLWSPPFDHTDRVFRPLVEKMGVSMKLELLHAGYYPRGGGRIDVKFRGGSSLSPIEIVTRKEMKSMMVRGAVSNLRDDIATRMTRNLKRLARDHGIESKKIKEDLHRPPSHNEGTYAYVETDFGDVSAGFTAYGEKGKRAEIVAEEAWGEVFEFMRSKAPIEPHLADQILLPLAFASGESAFATSKITGHLTTNASVIEQFGAAKIEIEGSEGGPGKVIVKPNSRTTV